MIQSKPSLQLMADKWFCGFLIENATLDTTKEWKPQKLRAVPPYQC